MKRSLSLTLWLITTIITAFRRLHGDAEGQYTYWSTRANGRPENRGLRLDYFVCSSSMFPSTDTDDEQPKKPTVCDSYILHSETVGVSDHCPVVLTVVR
jgi:exonuclease III